MSNPVLVTLIIGAGVFTLAGTATVAVNYFQAAQLAEAMKAQMDREVADRAAMTNLAWLEDYDTQYAGVNLQPTKERLEHVRSTVLDALSPHWYLTAGLICFAIGAALGVAAGIGSVVR
jgi:hypothetical protein